VASQVFESRPPAAAEQKTFEKTPTTAEPTVAAAAGGTGEVHTERRAARLQHEGRVPSKPGVGLMGGEGAVEMKTVAERAVDRVTHGIKLGKAVSAGS